MTPLEFAKTYPRTTRTIGVVAIVPAIIWAVVSRIAEEAKATLFLSFYDAMDYVREFRVMWRITRRDGDA